MLTFHTHRRALNSVDVVMQCSEQAGCHSADDEMLITAIIGLTVAHPFNTADIVSSGDTNNETKDGL